MLISFKTSINFKDPQDPDIFEEISEDALQASLKQSMKTNINIDDILAENNEEIALDEIDAEKQVVPDNNTDLEKASNEEAIDFIRTLDEESLDLRDLGVINELSNIVNDLDAEENIDHIEKKDLNIDYDEILNLTHVEKISPKIEEELQAKEPLVESNVNEESIANQSEIEEPQVTFNKNERSTEDQSEINKRNAMEKVIQQESFEKTRQEKVKNYIDNLENNLDTILMNPQASQIQPKNLEDLKTLVNNPDILNQAVEVVKANGIDTHCTISEGPGAQKQTVTPVVKSISEGYGR